METNYIKISTAITKSWIFKDANYFKWWVDMLTMAARNSHKVMHDSHLFTLERGQLIASIFSLSERWSKNRKTIIRFLNLLQKEDMIRRTVRDRQTPIITICNYERYQQSPDATADTLTDTLTDTTGTVDTLTDTTADTLTDTLRDTLNKNTIDYKTNSYTPFEEVKAIATDTLTDTTADTLTDTLTDTLKEKEKKEKRKKAKEKINKNKNKIISTTTTAQARTCEGEIQEDEEKEITETNGNNLFLSQERQNEILNELKDNQIFVETVCMNLHLTYLDVRNKLDEFQREVNAKLTRHRDEYDLRRHAYDWIRINKLKENNGRNTHSDTEAAEKRNREVREYVTNLLRN